MHFDFESSVTRADALRLMTERWGFATQTEYIPLTQSCGRVVSLDIYAENTLPVYRTSPFDGIAVKLSDFKERLPDPSCWVKGTDYVTADTGDDFPDEYDAVVTVEDIIYDGGKIVGFAEDLELIHGDELNQPGDLIKAGELIVRANTRLTPHHLALLAMGAILQVPVIRKPRIAFIPTGSELVPAGVTPLRGQNVDANSVMIEAYINAWGAQPVCFPIIRDDRAELKKLLDKALALTDIVIINGGSSKAAEDFCSTLMQERADFFRHGVRAVPGRPVAVSIINGKPVVNVPGPVLAAWLAADWCVCGLIHHYFGIPAPKRHFAKMKLTAPVKSPKEYEALLRMNVTKNDGVYTVDQIPRDATTIEYFDANGLLIVPIDIEGYAEGEEVEVELLKGVEYYA